MQQNNRGRGSRNRRRIKVFLKIILNSIHLFMDIGLSCSNLFTQQNTLQSLWLAALGAQSSIGGEDGAGGGDAGQSRLRSLLSGGE